MSALGPIEGGSFFAFCEHLHGFKYVEQGLKTAFLHDAHAVHLAPQHFSIKDSPHVITESYYRHGIDVNYGAHASAYDLRGTCR